MSAAEPESSTGSGSTPANGALLRLGPSRQVIGLGATVVVAVALPLLPQPITAPAWIAVAIAAVVFVAEPHPVVRRLFDAAGGIIATGLVLLLVAGTGGANSPLEDLYLLVLVYAAITRSWRRFGVYTGVVFAAVAVPGLVAGLGGDFWWDAVFDVAVWIAAAVVAGMLLRRVRDSNRESLRLRSVVDHLQDPIAILDADTLEVVYANEASAAAVGKEPHEMVGKRPDELLAGASGREHFLEIIDRARRDGGTASWERRIERGGDVAVYEATARLVDLDQQGEVLAIMSRDVTAQRTQREMEQRLAAIVAAADTAIVSCDIQGRIQTWNRSAERLYGWSAHDARNRRFAALVEPEDETPEVRLPEGPHQSYETRHRCADGSLVDVAVTISPIVADEGMSGTAILVRDITERQQQRRELEAREERFRRLAERSQGAVYRIRFVPELALEYANPRLEEITGFPLEELQADPELIYRRVHPDDRDELNRYRGPGEASPDGVVRFRFRHRSGEWIWLEDHRSPEIESGRVVADQGIAFDVTRRAEVERARARALDHERETARQLRRTMAAQEAFLRGISHELRTPLTSVLGLAGTLEAHLEHLPPQRARHLTQRLAHNARRLRGLLDDLLDLDRLSRGALQLDLDDNVDLSRLCVAVVEEIEAPNHTIDLRVGRTELTLDRPKIERVIDNLLRNAVKHTPAGSTVAVRLEMADDDVLLHVEDDGPGIPSELADEIFEPFRQGPQAGTSANPGTGVGLSLVRAFVSLHGGEVWYEDREPHGARFCIRLPRQPTEPEVTDRTVPQLQHIGNPEVGD
ncbi:MAG: PAS domain S-box protein [Nitriliruptorales bacterium]|nr:PAS domain S-box protein [Nitriliruptorales bacterium]